MIKYVSLDLTLNKLCNMNCKYCSAHSNIKEDIINFNLVKNIINEVHKEYPKNKINFVLLGGEVTLLPKGKLKEFIDYLCSLEYCGLINIFTNGKVYSQELAELSYYKNVYLRISMDTLNPLVNQRNITISELTNTIKRYNLARLCIDSTLNNITIPYYRELQDFFYNLGVRLFKIKFERNDAHIIENFTNSRDKFRDYMLKIMRKDVFYACDLHLNTVLITEITPKIDLGLHGEEIHNRNSRNIFGKLFVKKLWYGYE